MNKLTIATTNTDLDGEQFTPESLKDQDGKTIPIYLGFDHSVELGVGELEYDPKLDVLIINSEIDLDKLKGGFIVPEMINVERYQSNEISIIESAKIVSVGWTLHPSDPNVTKIK